jgi:type III secretion protein F
LAQQHPQRKALKPRLIWLCDCAPTLRVIFGVNWCDNSMACKRSCEPRPNAALTPQGTNKFKRAFWLLGRHVIFWIACPYQRLAIRPAGPISDQFLKEHAMTTASLSLSVDYINQTGLKALQTNEIKLRNAIKTVADKPEGPNATDMLELQQQVQQWSMMIQVVSTLTKEVTDALKGVVQKSA